MTYARAELESIGEAFTAAALLEWSGRILAAATEDLDRLAARGITRDHLYEVETARLEVERRKDLRKRERRPDPPLAAARRRALEEARDWRSELHGLAQAVFDTRPDLVERLRPGIKVSRSLELVIGEMTKLLEEVRGRGSELRAVGVDEAFVGRGREILARLVESLRRREEERARTPETTLELNWAKGLLYTKARTLARLARVEWRNVPSKAARYGYAPLRRPADAARIRA